MVKSSGVDLSSVQPNWDKTLPVNDPGGPCPSSSSRRLTSWRAYRMRRSRQGRGIAARSSVCGRLENSGNWTATTTAANNNTAWTVGFLGGGGFYNGKEALGRTWCVRDGRGMGERY